MPAAVPRVAVTTAIRPARDGEPGEDRIFTTPNAVIVLDGASQATPTERDGGWLADTLGGELHDRLAADPDADLTSALAQAIAAVARRHDLAPGASPSTTVAIARWTSDAVDALVLGDTVIIAELRSGELVELRDDRLHTIGQAERARVRAALDPKARAALNDAERAARNREGGYWIAEADPAAAEHAIAGSWPADELRTVIVATDGAAIGPDRLAAPRDWTTATALARRDVRAFLAAVHSAEEADPKRVRWPRSKRHDDKAVAVIAFTEEHDGGPITDRDFVERFYELVHQSPDRLVSAWEAFVDDVEAGYDSSIYEYENDLSVRATVERVLRDSTLGTMPQMSWVRERVAAADNRFRTLLRPNGRAAHGAPWWRASVPRYAGPELVDDVQRTFGIGLDTR